MKIILNQCYGGFSLSNMAKALYLMAKGQTPYFYADRSLYSKADGWKRTDKYVYVDIKDIETTEEKLYCTTQYQGEVLHEYPEHIFYDRELDRCDPTLASVVEIMGPKASGTFAQLNILEVDDNTLYRVEEYDGYEYLITPDDPDWEMATNNDVDDDYKNRIRDTWEKLRKGEE